MEGDFGFFILTVMLFVSGCDRGDRPSNIMVGYPLKGRPPATIHGQRCTAELAEEAFSLMEGRWKLVILYHLFGGDGSTTHVMRFSELERALPNVSQKMLIPQLRCLERDGIVQRTMHPLFRLKLNTN